MRSLEIGVALHNQYPFHNTGSAPNIIIRVEEISISKRGLKSVTFCLTITVAESTEVKAVQVMKNLMENIQVKKPINTYLQYYMPEKEVTRRIHTIR